MVKINCDILNCDDAPTSQPYYSPLNYCLLVRGEIKQFIKSYYNMTSALADRETYTFWEHFYRLSSHKTHEEAWFLMQTRWMHYLEDGSTLKLFSGVPAKWLEDGKLRVDNVASYFGRLSFSAEKAGNRIAISVHLDQTRLPSELHIRIPGDGISIASASEGKIRGNWIVIKKPCSVYNIVAVLDA
jgi:hypothetical protein